MEKSTVCDRKFTCSIHYDPAMPNCIGARSFEDGGRRFSLCGLGDRSELLDKKRRTGVFLDGVIIEAEFEVPEGYLLFCNFDCPFEESLVIHLISKDLEPLDERWYWGAYASGSLVRLRRLDERRFSFRFLGPCDWLLEVHPPRFGLPRIAAMHYAALGTRPLKSLLRRQWMTIRAGDPFDPNDSSQWEDPKPPPPPKRSGKKRRRKRSG